MLLLWQAVQWNWLSSTWSGTSIFNWDEVWELVWGESRQPRRPVPVGPRKPLERRYLIQKLGGELNPSDLVVWGEDFLFCCFPFFGNIEESCLYCPRHTQSCRLAMDWEEHSSTGHINDGLGQPSGTHQGYGNTSMFVNDSIFTYLHIFHILLGLKYFPTCHRLLEASQGAK